MDISASGHLSVDSLTAVCGNIGIFLHACVAIPEVESMGGSLDLKIPKAPSPCRFPQWLPCGCHFKVSPGGMTEGCGLSRGETVITVCSLSGVMPEEKNDEKNEEHMTAMMG